MASIVQEELQNIYDDVATLQEQVAALQTEVQTLTTQLAATNTSIADLEYQDIAENTDLHTLEVGHYFIPSGVICNTLTNRPDTTGQTAAIDVLPGGNTSNQKIMIYRPCLKESNKFYVAHYYADAWGAWLTVDNNDSGWIDLPLNTGWTMNDYDTEKPQYRKVGKVVMLRGLVNATSAAGNEIATLPSGFRPNKGYYNRWDCALGAANERVNVQVNTSGQIADWNKGTNTRMFLCLNGISFLVD